MRTARHQIADADELGDVGDGAPHVAAGHSRHLQREPDVLGDGHVRVDRVVLEDVADAPAFRRHRGDVAVVERQSSGRGLHESRDEPERRGLATSRGTDEGEELAIADLEGETVDGRHRAEPDGESVDGDAHG